MPLRSVPTFLQPRFGSIVYPIQRLKMGLESINLFNRAISPLGFDRPLLAVTKYHAEDRFAAILTILKFIAAFRWLARQIGCFS